MTAGVRVLALHGFLGRPSDWDGPATHLPPGTTVHAIDLWAVVEKPGVTDWPSMSTALDAALAGALEPGDARPAFLVAYSFGARLALASALAFGGGRGLRGTCLVSCNPGLDDADAAAREERRASDEEWARRIRTWPEPEIWRAWDAQPVFAGGGDGSARREGLPASRETLARALTTFSLAAQPDRRPRLRQWRAPLLWVTGARDARFVSIAGSLAESGVPATFITCEDAGHRVPWDNPADFARALGAWMTRITETES